MLKTLFWLCVILAAFWIYSRIRNARWEEIDEKEAVRRLREREFKSQSFHDLQAFNTNSLQALAELRRFVVLDLETTGLDPIFNRIIQIAAVRVYRYAKDPEFFKTYINPGEKIPAKVTALTGITDATVQDAPIISEVLPRLMNFIGDDVIIAHNAKFDLGFLTINNNIFRKIKINNKYICTLELARKKLNLANYKLGTVAEHYGLEQKRAHDALDDATVCGQVFLNLLAE